MRIHALMYLKPTKRELDENCFEVRVSEGSKKVSDLLELVIFDAMDQ